MNVEKAKTVAKKRQELKKQTLRFCIALGTVLLLVGCLMNLKVHAAAPSVSINLNTDGAGKGTAGGNGALQLLFLLTAIALAPSMLIMMTSFTRIVIVLSFLRNALGVQQTPPNQVIIGLALCLSMFIMAPVFNEMNQTAIEPYLNGKMTEQVAIEKVQKPLKVFMLKQTKVKDLNLFLSISGKEKEVKSISPKTLTHLGIEVIVPAFITSELKRAFTIGFLLFIPFLVIDMIVSSTLMSMGMVMLPPSMIALPFKLMLFVVVDGWDLLIGTLVKSFH